MARQHWERWLPEQYAAIEDPDAFFAALGEEAARQVGDLAAQLAGGDQPGEGYLERAGRLASARARAEEIVLPQRVLPPPEALAGESRATARDYGWRAGRARRRWTAATRPGLRWTLSSASAPASRATSLSGTPAQAGPAPAQGGGPRQCPGAAISQHGGSPVCRFC
jgi:hypothetical protein